MCTSKEHPHFFLYRRYTKLFPGEKKNSTTKLNTEQTQQPQISDAEVIGVLSCLQSTEVSKRLGPKKKKNLPETDSKFAPLKMGDPWNFGDSYWKAAFLGAISAILVSGRVRSVNFFLLKKCPGLLVLEMTCE